MTCRSCVCHAVSRLVHCCAGRGCNGPRCLVFGGDLSCVSTTELASQSETDVAVVVPVIVKRSLCPGTPLPRRSDAICSGSFSSSLGIMIEDICQRSTLQAVVQSPEFLVIVAELRVLILTKAGLKTRASHPQIWGGWHPEDLHAARDSVGVVHRILAEGVVAPRKWSFSNCQGIPGSRKHWGKIKLFFEAQD